MNTSVIPWQDDSELAMIRDWFYPHHKATNLFRIDGQDDQDDLRKDAVAKVNVWTFKTHQIPPAILATAYLTDSVVHYEEMMEENKSDSYRAVQFMFAFAFLRFVNSFVDRDVARAATASLAVSEDDVDEEGTVKALGESSMYAHAATISMPSRFVDLRHRLSHGVLPEIQVLKKATDEALSWLWIRWWKPNVLGDPTTSLERLRMTKKTAYSSTSGDL